MALIRNVVKEKNPWQLIRKQLIPCTLYALLPITLFRLYFHPNTTPHRSPLPQTPHIVISPDQVEVNAIFQTNVCDYTDGRWVPDSSGPSYNASTCTTIKDAQNCIAHGRSDLAYLYWRWQPHKCTLSRFNSTQFFRLMANKHIAFVGDSMARNQLESLLCILPSVSPPILVYDNHKFRRWNFPSCNLTVSVYWSPFLVDGIEKSNEGGADVNTLFLHRVDEKWAAELEHFDVVVLSIGHWYLHPALYFDGEDSVMGCHYCPGLNYTEVGFYGAMRAALRTAFQAVIDRRGWSSSNEMGVFLVTFSPSHFEGEWDKAGACPKTKPYEEEEKKLEGMDEEIRRIEIEEVEEARGRAKQSGGLRIEALDVTKLSLLRPDGHPGPYMHPFPYANGVGDRIQNDCVHWCLPGPVDTWNEILLEIMTNWENQSS